VQANSVTVTEKFMLSNISIIYKIVDFTYIKKFFYVAKHAHVKEIQEISARGYPLQINCE
jgi:hypothetical protein